MQLRNLLTRYVCHMQKIVAVLDRDCIKKTCSIYFADHDFSSLNVKVAVCSERRKINCGTLVCILSPVFCCLYLQNVFSFTFKTTNTSVFCHLSPQHKLVIFFDWLETKNFHYNVCWLLNTCDGNCIVLLNKCLHVVYTKERVKCERKFP